MPYLAKKPYCYDNLFANIRADWDAHDKGCESLQWLWLGQPGGVSCPSDLDRCADCRVLFYSEGVTNVHWEMHDADSLYLCSCCARERGLNVSGLLSQDLAGAMVHIEELPADDPATGGTT